MSAALNVRALVFVLVAFAVFVSNPRESLAVQVSFPRPDASNSIIVSSTQVTRWQEGQYEVLHLVGDVKIQQYPISARSNEAILWVETPNESAGKEHKVIVYLEDNVEIDLSSTGSDRIVDTKWLGRFFTTATVDLNQVTRSLGNRMPPLIFTRAQSALAAGTAGSVKQAGFVAPQQSVVVSPQTGAIQQVGPTFTTPNLGGQAQSFPQNNAGGLANPTRPPRQSSPFNIQVTGRDGGPLNDISRSFLSRRGTGFKA